MSQISKKPFLLFFILMFCIALPLFLFPINLFSGEIIMHSGLSDLKLQAPLSLSYFIGMGYKTEDMLLFKDFYLLPSGYILAVALIVGLPALVTYRIWIGNTKK